jgi:aspartyl-tRNA(Asn)/glutamyl-tRNA(Gln) amidotransferase subunit A
MTDLAKLTITEATKGLKNKDFSSVELTQACIKNSEKNKNLNIYITETFDKALEMAKKSDEKIAQGKTGKIEGIPLGIKDLFCTKDIRTTSASKMLENFVPPYESTVTKKLKDEGYVMMGKTNMDEFACGSTTKTSYFGATVNPYKKKGDDRDLIPGGSSGGSSAGVASDCFLGATGSDTGGSIRQPSALCNLVGSKPTYGRASRYGMVAYASSFDQAGMLTKTIKDNALLTEIICGFDKKDSTSSTKKVPNFSELLNSDVKGKKIGIVKEFMNIDKVHPEIYEALNKAIKELQKKGAEIKEISLPNAKYSGSLYTILSYTELASNLARYDGVRYTHRSEKELLSLDELYSKSRSEGFCENIKKRILLGYHMSSSENYEKYFLHAQKVRRILAEDFKKVFNEVDVILTPTTPNVAFPINMTEEEKKMDLASNYLNDLFTIPVNLTGLPAISIPAGFSKDGLPMGLQVISNYFDEQAMFDVGLALEEIK